MKKKGLSILLSICMVFTLPFSLPVSAAGKDKPTAITMKGIDGLPVNAMTAAPGQLPQGVSYNAQTNTLTLDNVTLTDYVEGQSKAVFLIQESANLTIRLIGQNTIRTDTGCGFGMILLDGSADQNTVITGDGSLLVDGPSSAAIRTNGKLIIDSSVALLAGFGGKTMFSANGGITINGKPYTGTLAEGAVVNGKVADKVRKTRLDLTAESAGYGTDGKAFNPQTTSITAEETGEGWGWNHKSQTLTLSGAVLYSPINTVYQDYNYALGLGSATIELAEGTANAVVSSESAKDDREAFVYNGIQSYSLNIVGSGSLMCISGRNNNPATGNSSGIDCNAFTVSGSVRVTCISPDIGIRAGSSVSISGSAQVLAVGGVRDGLSHYTNGSISISGQARLEARGAQNGIKNWDGLIEISGGTVKAYGGTGGGIYSDSQFSDSGNVRITGGTVEAVGGRYGVYTTLGLTVTGGSLTASGTAAALCSKTGAPITVNPAEKSLSVYGGAAAPGEKLAMVAAPNTDTLTGEQLASKYMHIAYEPLQTDGKNVNAVYIPGGAMETVYSVDVTWGSMDFTYSPGHAGVWNPDTHRLDGVVPAGWSCEEGANKVRVVNHSNTAVDVGFAYTKAAGFDGVAGAFDHAGEKLPSAMGTAVDAAPETLAVLTMSGALPASTTEKIQIGTVTVSIDTAAGE